MLPDNLSGSYKAYKSDTNAFVTWLSRTALTCGYKFPRANADIGPAPPAEKTSGAPSTRLKGKARKEAKAAASKPAPAAATGSKQIVSTSDLLAQAKHIANYKKPPVKVPVGIQYVLRQAIQARKRCAEWFRKATAEGNSSDHEHSSANASHQHFIRILELAADVLRPCFESSLASNPCALSLDGTQLSDKQNSQNSLNNRFGSLEIEDIDEHELHLMATAALSPAPTTSRNSKSQSRDVFELGVDIRSELPFILFCFFEDMNKIRKFLISIWTKVAAGTLDSMAASITTNAALELVRKAEEEIILLSPELRNTDTYQSMSFQMFPLVEASSFQDIPGIGSLRGEVDIEEYMFYSVFLSLANYAATVQQQGTGPRCTSVAHLCSIMPEQIPKNPEWETEDRLLARMLLDLELKRWTNSGEDNPQQAQYSQWREAGKYSFRPLPFEDEVIRSFESVLKSKRVDAYVVFNARVLLDIHKTICSQVQAVYKSLRLRGAVAEKVLGLDWTLDLAMKARGIVQSDAEVQAKWLRTDLIHEAIQLSITVESLIKGNQMIQNKELLLSASMPGLSMAMAQSHFSIWPSPDSSFFASNNPINAGVEALRLVLGLDKTGVNLANAFGSIAPMAHLYNAMQQKGLLRGRWYALDKVIEAYISPIFKGSLPTTQEQCNRRCCLFIQIPVEAFASDGKPPDYRRIARNFKDTFQHDALSKPLMKYLEGESSAERLLYALHNLRKKNSRAIALTQLEMLEQLCEGVSQVLPKLEIDMITLTRQCDKLLDQFREKLDISIDHGIPDDELHQLDHRMAVAHILGGWGDNLTSLQGTPDANTPTDLQVAAEITQDFLPEANHPVAVQPFDVVAIANETIAESKRVIISAMANSLERMFAQFAEGML